MQVNQKSSWFERFYPWLIWSVAASFFFYKYLIQVSPSVMTSDLMQAFNLNGAGLGHLSACYFYAYLIMQIPIGIMLDKYSPRIITSFAIFICAGATFLFSQTHEFFFAEVSRALMGMGAAFAAISCFKLASIWFKPNRFALISGMFMTAAMLGAVGGQMPLSILVQNHGWRSALKFIAIIGLVLGLIYFLIVRDKKIDDGRATEKKEKTRYLWIKILINPQTWLLSFYSGLAFAPLSVFGGLWGVPFLQTAYQFSKSDAALAVSSIFIGFAIGAPALGWLSDFMGRRKPILYLGTLLSILSLSIVIYGYHLSAQEVMILLFLFGVGASGFFTSFAMIRELFPLPLAATVLGFMNTFDSICEAVYEPMVGAFLDFNWSGQILNGIHEFNLKAYHISLILLPASLLLSLITLFFIKETHCKPNQNGDGAEALI